MKKDELIDEIYKLESYLIIISEKLKTAKEFDTIDAWLRKVIREDQEIAKLFLIPTEDSIKKAIIVLITENSAIHNSIINMLANSIVSHISTAIDFENHPMKGMVIEKISDNLEPLVKLTEKYNSYIENTKNISLVCQALKDNRLHIYKSSNWEPDIRVVLKTLQLDKYRDSKEEVNYLLSFLFQQLKSNLNKRGTITNPRHAWWALLDIVTESEKAWLKKRKYYLNKIVKSLIEDTEYSFYVPNTNSIYYERIWVTINAIKIFKSNIKLILSQKNIDLLMKRIELELNTIVSSATDGSVKNLLCKLLLLYEAFGYYNYIEAIKTTNQSAFNITKNYIGKYLYTNETVKQFNVIKKTISHFIKNKNKWTKHILTTMIISGSAGQGKSELIDQVLHEIKDLSIKNEFGFEFEKYSTGTNFNTKEELADILKKLKMNRENSKKIRAIVFDEFDKATFDFYSPFLSYLETDTVEDDPLTVWIFAQSSFATFNMFKYHANSLENKAQRDFLTRMQLGAIDIPELRTTALQKIYTILGYTLNKAPNVGEISKECLFFFANNDALKNNRDLIKLFTKKSKILNDRSITLSESVDFPFNFKVKNSSGSIKIIKK